MRTIEIKGHAEDEDYSCDQETYEHPGKSARDVLREGYKDTCVLKPLEQPRSITKSVKRPTTYHVYDREGVEKKDEEYTNWEATLIELPD